MSTALQQVAEWIYTTLTGDTIIAGLVGSHVYQNLNKEKSPVYPCIVFSAIPGPDTRMVGGGIAKTNVAYLIRAISDTTASSIDAVAVRIQTLLDNAASANIVFCERSMPFDREYTEGSVTYYERGGVYQTMIIGA